MPHDDVRKALEAMEDDGFRERYAAGDFTPVPGLNLSDEEQQLVQDAATDYPEVAGFAFEGYLESLGDGSVFKAGHKDLQSVKGDNISVKFKKATSYALKLQ